MLLCIPVLGIGQQPEKNIRYNYNLEFNQFTNPPVTKNVDMVLDVLDDQSYFSDKKFVEFQNEVELAENSKNNSEYVKLLKQAKSKYNKKNYLVINSVGNENVTYERFKNNKFKLVEQKKDIIWNIEPTKFKWKNYEVKQANADIDGRNWTVLFTTDINQQSGPHKFNNLPGFVVKAWDKNKNFVFEYIGSEKITSPNTYLAEPNDYIEMSLHEKKLLKELYYPDLANKKNHYSRATNEKIDTIENSIDLSFIEIIEN